MIYDIVISNQAEIDLRGIFEYIAFEQQADTDDNADSDDNFYDDVIAQSALNWMEKD